MGKQSRRLVNSPLVSASDLAQMGRCERLVLLEHLYGKRRTARQQQARERGRVEHEQFFYREGLVASAHANRKWRCFIATCIFGEAWQTQVLRRLRAEVLRQSVWGRHLIRLYYHVAPNICEVLCRWPSLQGPVRMVLGAIAMGFRCWSDLCGGGKCRR